MREQDWSRLAGFVSARITELDITQAQIQQRGGPSPAKIREIVSRRATTLSPSKRRDLERALCWAAGSVDAVLAGGDPITDDPKADGANRTEPEPSAAWPGDTGLETLILVAETLLKMPYAEPQKRQLRQAIRDARHGAELLRPMSHIPEAQIANLENARQLAAVVKELGHGFAVNAATSTNRSFSGSDLVPDAAFGALSALMPDVRAAAERMEDRFLRSALLAGRAKIDTKYFVRGNAADAINDLFDRVNPHVIGQDPSPVRIATWREWLTELSAAIIAYDDANVEIQRQIVRALPDCTPDQLEGSVSYVEAGKNFDWTLESAIQGLQHHWTQSESLNEDQVALLEYEAERLRRSRLEAVGYQKATLTVINTRLEEVQRAWHGLDLEQAEPPPTTAGAKDVTAHWH